MPLARMMDPLSLGPDRVNPWNKNMKKPYASLIRSTFAGVLLLSTQLASADVISSTIASVERTGASSTTVVAPAQIASFRAYENATVQLLGGQISWLDLYDDSAAEISGGDVSWLQLHGRSSVRLTGAVDLSWLVIGSPDAHVEIVASNVQYQQGHLSGYWSDHSFFDFWAVSDLSAPSTVMPSNITVSAVPEPSSALLTLCGLALLTAGKRRRRV
jgi:hypothetical protein